MSRIKDKIIEIEKFLEELETIIPNSIEEYSSSLEKKAACERYIEKIVESATDLSFLIIKAKKFRIPQDDADAFSILLENKIIDDKIAASLKNAKGMRNIIAHQYGKVDDEIVFHSITEEIVDDMNAFLDSIEKADINQ
jgi:uncharacterized protein YutE (UPF0331/DUF86 family)